MRLVVTGGAGFIGSNFVLNALGEDDVESVLNIDKLDYGSNLVNLSAAELNPKYRFLSMDIRETEKMLALTKGYDCIINFAAKSHVDRSVADPTSFVDNNVLSTNSVLEVARKNDVKLLQISTDEVYGSAKGKPFDETDRLEPGNPYSASKAAGDLLVLSYINTYGIWANITRCTNNYGPRQFPEKLIPKSILAIKRGEKIPLYGDGENRRDWLFVNDHISAIFSVLRSNIYGQVYNISSGIETTNKELIQKLCTIMGVGYLENTKFVEDRPGHDRWYSLSSRKIREKLGWVPATTLEEGLRVTVQWYLDNLESYRTLDWTDQNLGVSPWKKQ